MTPDHQILNQPPQFAVVQRARGRHLAVDLQAVYVQHIELHGQPVDEQGIHESVAALTVQGFSLPELTVHIKAALNCGAKKEEILEVITQMLAYCGFPAATNALLTADQVFQELGI